MKQQIPKINQKNSHRQKSGMNVVCAEGKKQLYENLM